MLVKVISINKLKYCNKGTKFNILNRKFTAFLILQLFRDAIHREPSVVLPKTGYGIRNECQYRPRSVTETVIFVSP